MLTIDQMRELSPAEARLLIREGKLDQMGSVADGYMQVNMVCLPEKYADDFREFCRRNPVPCPLVSETAVGDPTVVLDVQKHKLLENGNVATDIPKYCVYHGGDLVSVEKNIVEQWKENYVGFLIGCSFSFEGALHKAGFPSRYRIKGTVVSMYKTNIKLCPSGVFKGYYVVSMRPIKADKIEEVRKITSKYGQCHGSPIAWGYEEALEIGIKDIAKPDYGDPIEILEDEIPVFWGCGVTPQYALVEANLPEEVYSHHPGFPLVLDIHENDFFGL
ncbi:unnamed protein product [Kuraishia capsulata CBS 1993]|uniref:DUF1445 domain-containing protein n=1 Tax=Kuraishia capsulata CBS 1993 TaxID=1382522 RepID=W6MQT9_9ASCO|nr:uncharacterized protein KUCA_T00005022001 [Kuraishia capsulata CBS 1993]CDK29036.1 unnamed protein product [Kuraishia capsulata CBS 1993]